MVKDELDGALIILEIMNKNQLKPFLLAILNNFSLALKKVDEYFVAENHTTRLGLNFDLKCLKRG